ncbi:hypothetical protein B0H17DRAFT_1143470 [Mycena rosella]|uniref:Uncharacterized protein n=1 Tax=Mycena rosella TaxID=1033263 RepID=A0AAD7CUX6_MYCRO|nr:hypothetical protein B0H17DRAFT_1143470 [Mycena rosella]
MGAYEPDIVHRKPILLLSSSPSEEDALREIMSAIPTAAITHLDVRECAAVTQYTWSTAFRALPALETVSFQATDSHAALLDALADLDPAVRSLRIFVTILEADTPRLTYPSNFDGAMNSSSCRCHQRRLARFASLMPSTTELGGWIVTRNTQLFEHSDLR